MPRLLLFIPLALFVGIGLLMWKGLSLDPNSLPSALLDKPVPAFSLPSLYNPEKMLTPLDLKGKPALVNVWATWCPSCKQEHPQLLHIAEKEKVPVYGINYKDDREAAKAWLQRYRNPYTFNIFDQDGKLGLDLGVYGAPETYLLDQNGIIRYRHAGPVTPEIWDIIRKKMNSFSTANNANGMNG
ncbi:MAG: DsbE family thiol:disulfide interchange protein [Methylococcaceae bacterium]